MAQRALGRSLTRTTRRRLRQVLKGCRQTGAPHGPSTMGSVGKPWGRQAAGTAPSAGTSCFRALITNSAAAVVDHAYAQGWPPLPGAALPYVTAGLDLRYLRPSPLDAEVELWGEVVDASESAIDALVWLEYDGKRRAEARAHWRRWRPR